MKLLILYPHNFKSFSKFSRKLGNILSEKNVNEVIFSSDPNNFIRDYFKETLKKTDLHQSESWAEINISHAIIFDDGEEFPDEYQQLKKIGVSTRRIKIAITRVINIKREEHYKGIKSTPAYEYIGRGSYWGNPYSMHEDGSSREEVIHKFKYDFDYEKFPNKEKSEVYKLAGKRLGCFCKPEACHGDILADFLNSWDDGN